MPIKTRIRSAACRATMPLTKCLDRSHRSHHFCPQTYAWSDLFTACLSSVDSLTFFRPHRYLCDDNGRRGRNIVLAEYRAVIIRLILLFDAHPASASFFAFRFFIELSGFSDTFIGAKLPRHGHTVLVCRFRFIVDADIFASKAALISSRRGQRFVLYKCKMLQMLLNFLKN